MATEPRALKPSFKQPIKRKRGEKPTAPPAAASPDVEADMSDEERELEARKGILENTVGNIIRENMSARQNSGIEEIWADSDDLYNGEDLVDGGGQRMVKTRDKAPRKGGSDTRATFVLNITKPKTDTGVARVQEMLVPHDDKPWELGPSPIPEFDEDIGPTETVTTADGKQVPAALVAEYMKDMAGKAAREESDWIEDKLVEGEVYAELRKVIRNAGRKGTGVLKGPTPVSRTIRKWEMSGNVAALKITERIDPTSVCVRAEDCFPDAACGENIHDGSNFVERDHITTRKLRELAKLPDYDGQAIAQALVEGPTAGIMARNDTRAQRREGEAVRESALFEVFYVYCDLSPEDLVLLGGDPRNLSAEELALEQVPAVVTMLNGRAIKATVNPQEKARFPYDFFTWDQIEGQPWGRGIPWKMKVAQQGVTAGARGLMENAGLSLGPMIAFIKGALTPIDGKYEVRARKMFEFEPDDVIDDVRKAFATFDIPNVQTELLELVQFWLDMADQLTNLPMLLQGQQAAGTSPETLGGQRMLMSNASAPLRVIAKQFDDQIIVPHFGGYHDWFMEKVNDPRIAPNKQFCDTIIKARGSTVLVQREEAREFLAMLFPVKDDPSLKIDPAKFAAEFARANGFNLKAVQFASDEEFEAYQKKKGPPPKAPQVEAAEIRNQGLIDVAKLKAEDAAAERQLKEFLAAVEKELGIMKLSGSENVSIEQIKAMLAKSAMDNMLKRDEMQLKLMPANESGEGI
jgi:hypothetical protein